MNINPTSRIYIAGHRGMVGSAIWRALEAKGYSNLIGKTSTELDLKNKAAVLDFFQTEKPEIVLDAAAKVGGIMANNSYPYQFLMENMQIQNNLIDASLQVAVQKFIFLGSSCIYPKLAPQPLKEEYLLTGPLEPTNEWYALAKIAGVKACEAIRRQYGKDYISLMPTNLYGPFDNFDLHTSHVLPAMIRKFHDAKHQALAAQVYHAELGDSFETTRDKPVVLWGTGTPFREFLFVEDLAEAAVFSMENEFRDNLYNVGTGHDLSIKQLALLIQEIVGHKGEILWDAGKPDGTPRKLMDVSKMTAAGWQAKTSLEDGIRKTYQWFLEHQNSFKEVKI